MTIKKSKLKYEYDVIHIYDPVPVWKFAHYCLNRTNRMPMSAFAPRFHVMLLNTNVNVKLMRDTVVSLGLY